MFVNLFLFDYLLCPFIILLYFILLLQLIPNKTERCYLATNWNTISLFFTVSFQATFLMGLVLANDNDPAINNNKHIKHRKPLYEGNAIFIYDFTAVTITASYETSTVEIL